MFRCQIIRLLLFINLSLIAGQHPVTIIAERYGEGKTEGGATTKAAKKWMRDIIIKKYSKEIKFHKKELGQLLKNWKDYCRIIEIVSRQEKDKEIYVKASIEIRYNDFMKALVLIFGTPKIDGLKFAFVPEKGSDNEITQKLLKRMQRKLGKKRFTVIDLEHAQDLKEGRDFLATPNNIAEVDITIYVEGKVEYKKNPIKNRKTYYHSLKVRCLERIFSKEIVNVEDETVDSEAYDDRDKSERYIVEKVCRQVVEQFCSEDCLPKNGYLIHFGGLSHVDHRDTIKEKIIEDLEEKGIVEFREYDMPSDSEVRVYIRWLGDESRPVIIEKLKELCEEQEIVVQSNRNFPRLIFFYEGEIDPFAKPNETQDVPFFFPSSNDQYWVFPKKKYEFGDGDSIENIAFQWSGETSDDWYTYIFWWSGIEKDVVLMVPNKHIREFFVEKEETYFFPNGYADLVASANEFGQYQGRLIFLASPRVLFPDRSRFDKQYISLSGEEFLNLKNDLLHGKPYGSGIISIEISAKKGQK